MRCLLKCLSVCAQVFQGADSRDGSEAWSWLPVRRPRPLHPRAYQHHHLRTGGQIHTFTHMHWTHPVFCSYRFILISVCLIPSGGTVREGRGVYKDRTKPRLCCRHLSYQPLWVLPHFPHQGVWMLLFHNDSNTSLRWPQMSKVKLENRFTVLKE